LFGNHSDHQLYHAAPGKASERQQETPINYIEAYRQILLTCADKFFDQTAIFSTEIDEYLEAYPEDKEGLNRPNKTSFLEDVGNNFGRYMHQWGLKIT